MFDAYTLKTTKRLLSMFDERDPVGLSFNPYYQSGSDYRDKYEHLLAKLLPLSVLTDEEYDALPEAAHNGWDPTLRPGWDELPDKDRLQVFRSLHRAATGPLVDHIVEQKKILARKLKALLLLSADAEGGIEGGINVDAYSYASVSDAATLIKVLDPDEVSAYIDAYADYQQVEDDLWELVDACEFPTP